MFVRLHKNTKTFQMEGKFQFKNDYFEETALSKKRNIIECQM